MNDASETELVRRCDLALECEPEWDGITRAHHNVLLEGPRDATEAAILLLMPYLSEPVLRRRPGEAFELGASPCRTLIVQDVGALHPDQQTRLREWLDRAPGRVQIVSTNRSALFSLVMRGLFDEGLYYRLNAMLLHVPHLSPPSRIEQEQVESRFATSRTGELRQQAEAADATARSEDDDAVA
jgi:hypothetical protein